MKGAEVIWRAAQTFPQGPPVHASSRGGMRGGTGQMTLMLLMPPDLSLFRTLTNAER